MSIPRVLLDANVMLRFTLDDHKVLSARATTYFERAGAGEVVLVVPGITLAECAYTMKSFYKLGRQDIAAGLQKVLSLPNVEPLEPSLRQALTFFGEKNVDFADAYLAALAHEKGLSVGSFDRDLNKLDVTIFQ